MLRWLSFAIALSTAAPALAQPGPSEDSPARVHHDAGARFYELGEYERAIEEWTRAYELSQLPLILYNLYSVHERAGNLAEAADYLERFLASGAEVESRSSLESRLVSLRERIAREREAEAEPAAEAATDDRAPPPPADDGPSGLMVGGVVALGVAAAAAITVAIFGGLAAGEYGRLEDVCGGGCADAATGDLVTYNTVADVSLGVALVTAATGLVLLVVDATSGSETTVSVGPGGVRLRGAF